jgi:perosamine synthetase
MLQPAAITPISFFDVLTAYLGKSKGNHKFELIISKYFDNYNVCMFASLMRTTLAALNLLCKLQPQRNKIILPRYSCPSFLHAVLESNLEVVYVDQDPLTLSIDLEKLYEIDKKGVLCIIVANLFGLSSDIKKICDYCKENGIFVIEGVDYGIGTIYKNRKIGLWGDLAILNFQEGKAIPVSGGAIITKLDVKSIKPKTKCSANLFQMLAFSLFSRPFFYYILRRLINTLGISRRALSMEDTMKTTRNEVEYKYNKNEEWKTISDFQGSLGCILWQKMECHSNVRRLNARKLEKILSEFNEINIIKIETEVDYDSVHYIRYPILVPSEIRTKLLKNLFNVGIEGSAMYVEDGMIINEREFPGASKISMMLLTIPCHPIMTAEDFENINIIFKKVLNE